MRLREILFPTDFSSASEVAGRVAHDMALQAGARLHVLHVVPMVTDRSQVAERLTVVAKSLGAGPIVETALVSGGPPARSSAMRARRGSTSSCSVPTGGQG